MSIYLEAAISTVAVSCASLAHEVFRMTTDVNKTVLIEAAKAGIILTLLMELHLAKRLKYNKVSFCDVICQNLEILRKIIFVYTIKV